MERDAATRWLLASPSAPRQLATLGNKVTTYKIISHHDPIFHGSTAVDGEFELDLFLLSGCRLINSRHLFALGVGVLALWLGFFLGVSLRKGKVRFDQDNGRYLRLP